MQIKDYVKSYDITLQFNVLKESYKQIEYALGLNINIPVVKKITSVVVTGMGGSAISADLAMNYLQDEIRVPFFVNRSYNLPAFADDNTLIVISSYSGNTEESVSVFHQAIKRHCMIIAITTGGEVQKICESNKIPFISLMPGMQPRYALGQSFFTLLRVLENLKIIPSQETVIKEIRDIWRESGEALSGENNTAFNYARELIGFIPVIYSAAYITDAIGYRFKCQLNENSKIHAFHNVIPEMNHNEIIGWESFNQKEIRAKVINIIDRDYPEQVRKRFEITSGLITAKDTNIINLESKQNIFKKRIFDLIYLTDWISYYMAVLRGFDPVEIDYIHLLKKKLS
jgi:glucose/mannose-6-phosphate isomerase